MPAAVAHFTVSVTFFITVILTSDLLISFS